MQSDRLMMPVTEKARSLGHIVLFKDQVPENDVQAHANRMARQHRLTVDSVFTAGLKGFASSLPLQAVNAILQREGAIVQSIEPDLEIKGYAQTVPWGISRIGTTDAGCSATIDGASTPSMNVDLFILDTGVQASHPDLNVVESLSFVRTERATDDGNGHGTACAGVAAAKDNSEYVVGVAPGARIHSYKVLDRTGSGSFSYAISAVDRVMKWKAQNPTAQNKVVINLSLGAYTGSTAYSTFDNALVKAIQNGITVVVAAGNDGHDAAYYSPAHVTQAITVGAYDVGNRLTTWSNYGSVVDILAPGANILTTYIRNNTAVVSGTSFSAPYVAGAAALYLRQNPTSTPSQVAAALVAKAANDYSGANPAVIVGVPNTTNRSLYVREL